LRFKIKKKIKKQASTTIMKVWSSIPSEKQGTVLAFLNIENLQARISVLKRVLEAGTILGEKGLIAIF
jgi:hypothetical protein